MSAEDIDYTDLAAVNEALISIRHRVVDSRRAQTQARRDRIAAKLALSHARNLALVNLVAETEANRAALVELQTQDDVTAYLVSNGVYEEVDQRAKEARSDLESLKEQGNNLRRQMEMGYR